MNKSKINEDQLRLWLSMIDIIDEYLNGGNGDFYSTVGKLEGALDAAEIEDKKLINQWYDFWTPLEIRRATEGNNPTRDKAISELKEMKNFLATSEKNAVIR